MDGKQKNSGDEEDIVSERKGQNTKGWKKEEIQMTDADFERAMQMLQEEGNEEVNELLSEFKSLKNFKINPPTNFHSGNERKSDY